MKIVYEEGEIESLEKLHKELIDKGRAVLFPVGVDPDRVYSLSFKVTKPGLAEYLLISALNNRLEDFDLGIDIVSINFGAIQNKEDVRQKLHRAIDEIID